MGKFTKFKAAYIQWLDAHSQGNKWTDETTARDYIMVDFEVHHLCFVLDDKSDKNAILVSPRIAIYSDDTAEKFFGDVMKIPKSWIKEIKYLDIEL